MENKLKRHLVGKVIFVNEGIGKPAGYIHVTACGYTNNYLWPVTPKYSLTNAVYHDMTNKHLVTCKKCIKHF